MDLSNPTRKLVSIMCLPGLYIVTMLFYSNVRKAEAHMSDIQTLFASFQDSAGLESIFTKVEAIPSEYLRASYVG